jgi:hypothetical protein
VDLTMDQKKKKKIYPGKRENTEENCTKFQSPPDNMRRLNVYIL